MAKRTLGRDGEKERKKSFIWGSFSPRFITKTWLYANLYQIARSCAIIFRAFSRFVERRRAKQLARGQIGKMTAYPRFKAGSEKRLPKSFQEKWQSADDSFSRSQTLFSRPGKHVAPISWLNHLLNGWASSISGPDLTLSLLMSSETTTPSSSNLLSKSDASKRSKWFAYTVSPSDYITSSKFHQFSHE